MREKAKSLDTILRRIKNRVTRKNRNFMGVFVGGTGSGKTYAALSMAKTLDPKFDMSRIVFSAKDFLELLQQKLPKGSCIVWDETGIGINARMFYEQTNLAISYTTQTFRYKNYIVLFTVPSFSYIDKQVRQLFHARIKMLGFNSKKKFSWGKWAWIDYNTDTGKIYYKHPRIKVGGQLAQVGCIYFAPPEKEMISSYEAKRKEVMVELYKRYHGNIDSATGKTQGNIAAESSNIVTKVKENLKDYVGSKGGILISKIVSDFGVSYYKATNIAWQIKKETTTKTST